MGTRAERDRLLGTKQIRYKVVLCSSGSTANILTFYGAQRGVWERTDTCTCVAESLQRPPETVTVLGWAFPLEDSPHKVYPTKLL